MPRPATSKPAGPSVATGRVSKPTKNSSKGFQFSTVAGDAPAPKPAGSARKGAKQLNETQEKQLVEWITEVKDLSTLPSTTQITASANQILESEGQEGKIGKAWVEHLFERIPANLVPSKTRPQKKTRLGPEDNEALASFFCRLEPLINSTAPQNIYNFDETVFQIGEGTGPRYVFALKGEKLNYSSRDFPRTYCEWITGIDCIAADGWSTDPCLVIQGEYDFDNWFPTMPEKYAYDQSPKGRLTDENGMTWIKHFDAQTQDRANGQPRLVLFRNHAPFVTFSFLQYCKENSIIPFCFPPNIGHLIQPFDGKNFRKYKDHWKIAQPPDDAELEKISFVKNLATNRKEAFSSANIKDSFEKSGIYPFDSKKKVLPSMPF